MMTDDTALRAWESRQDAEAFHEIVNRYVDMVYGTCWRVLRNTADAEEVTQECFAALSEKKNLPVGYLGPWLHRVALNLSHKRQRSEIRRVQRESTYAAEVSRATEMNWDDLHEHIDVALEALPEKLRVPLVAHFLQRQTHATIAENLNIPRQTVTNRIKRGIEEVRKILKKRGVIVTSAALFLFLREGTAQAAPSHVVSALGKAAIAGQIPTDAAILPTAATEVKYMVVKWLAVIVLSTTAVGSGIWAYSALSSEASEVSNNTLQATQSQSLMPVTTAPEEGRGSNSGNVSQTQPSNQGNNNNGVHGYVIHINR